MSGLFVRPTSLAEVAADRVAEPGILLWKGLAEFLDDFYEKGSLASMVEEEPIALINQQEAAYLAGTAEYLSILYDFACPGWANWPRYFLRAAYYPGPWRSRLVDAMCSVESPYAFRRRCVFVEVGPLRRKQGPIGCLRRLEQLGALQGVGTYGIAQSDISNDPNDTASAATRRPK